MRALSCLLIGLLLAAQASLPAWAGDYLAGPDDYRAFLPRLLPGDRLLLRAGDYERGLPLQHLAGEPGRPIVIEGEIVPPARPDGSSRLIHPLPHPLPSGTPGGASRSWGGPAIDLRSGARFLAHPGSNTVSLLDVSHIVIRNLELDGRNQPVDAVKAEGHGRYAHYVTLENLYIHDHAASQQNVGISSKCPAFGWIVRGNRIERVGTGMYFGDSDGSDPFVAGLIEGNRVSDTIGYNLQIKHQNGRPADLPEADRRHDTVIRGNFFAKETAWPDRAARPNVLVGHAPPSGAGAQDRVLVYGNLFWQNPSEALFQGEGNLAIYNNVFVNSQGNAVHIQPHNDVPRQVNVFHNTVLARGHGIRILTSRSPGRPKSGLAPQGGGSGALTEPGAILNREGTRPAWPQRVMRNLVFAGQPLSGGEASDNLSGNVDSAARFLKKPFAELEQLDLAPRMALAGEIRPDTLADYPDSDQDIDGRARTAPVLGACLADIQSPCPRVIHVR